MSKLRQVLIIDEASISFAKELSGVPGVGYITHQKKMPTQLRSADVGLIFGAQSVSAIEPAVPANAGSFLCLGARTDADTRLSTTLLGLQDDRRNDVRHLSRWKGLFKSAEHSVAVLIDLPDMDMGDYLCDSAVAQLNAPAIARLNEHVIWSPAAGDVGSPICYTDVLGETTPAATPEKPSAGPLHITADHKAFVQDILDHPQASVTEHYKNRAFSAGRGTRLKGELLDDGIIVSERLPSSNGRPVERLTITEKGRRLFCNE